MKIGIAQIKSLAGDIQHNTEKHLALLKLALKGNAELVFFPELSITAYEPELISSSISSFDFTSSFDTFKNFSDQNNVIIGVGAPLKKATGIQIAMHWFQKDKAPLSYAKQTLHEDEFPYFICGDKQLIIEMGEYKIAPAICYESMLTQHAQKACAKNANVYLASVAKCRQGIKNGMDHYPKIAKKYGLSVLLANAIGECDNFMSAGSSCAWNAKGEKLAQLNENSEGVLIVDLANDKTSILELHNTCGA